MLTQEDKENILSTFPNIKLSYEKITHKKVYNFDIAIAIPEGKKSFIWFTFYNDKMLCLLLEFDEQQKKQIKNIKIMNCCFSKFLCYGTIFYGTYFNYLNNPFFCIEDVFMYKGNFILDCNIITKINKICDILKNDIQQLSYNNYCLVFGLPVIFMQSNESSKIFETIKYKLSCIKYYNKNNINSHFMILFDEYIKNNDVKLPEKIYKNENIHKIYNNKIENPKTENPKIENPKTENPKTENPKIEKIKTEKIKQEINKLKIFIIKPYIQNDIYYLYSLENEYIGIACIPDFKTSVMMNKLFRNIKENNDLDTLEESDDENEFENPNIDKFVDLTKSYKMLCNFNTKFKKWVPIKITD